MTLTNRQSETVNRWANAMNKNLSYLYFTSIFTLSPRLKPGPIIVLYLPPSLFEATADMSVQESSMFFLL